MTRVVTALVLGALVVYLVAVAPPVLGTFAVLAAVLTAAHETSALFGTTAGSFIAPVPAVAAVFLIVGGAWAGGVEGLSAGLTAGLALMFVWILLKGEVEGSVLLYSGCSLVLLYPAWSLAHTILYLESETGRRALLFLLLCVWACDSAAFFMGSTLGRRKLVPRISPNKTVAGAVGGTLGAAGASLVLYLFRLVPWSAAFTVCAGLFLALLAQAGDLVESMLKRDAGVKDSGVIIPGHGGILDRVDALLFAVPVFYYVLLISGLLV